MLVQLIMPVAIPVLVAGGVAILVPLIMLALASWPHIAEGSGDGLPRGPAATAVEAPRAITPAAKAPIIKGRLKVITFRRRAP